MDMYACIIVQYCTPGFQGRCHKFFSGPADLADGLLHFVLVLQHADHVGRVLDDERHDGDEGQTEHLRQVDLLAAPRGRVQAAASLHLPRA